MAVSPDGRWMVFPAIGEDGVAATGCGPSIRSRLARFHGTEARTSRPHGRPDSRYVIFSPLIGTLLKKWTFRADRRRRLRMLGDLNGARENRMASSSSDRRLCSPCSACQPAGVPLPVTVLAEGRPATGSPSSCPMAVIFSIAVSGDPNQMGVYVGSIDAKPEEQTQRAACEQPAGLLCRRRRGGLGHLISLRETTLMAQPFDPRLKLSGDRSRSLKASTRAGNPTVCSRCRTPARSRIGRAWDRRGWRSRGSTRRGSLERMQGDRAITRIQPCRRMRHASRWPSRPRSGHLDRGRGARHATRFTFDPASDDIRCGRRMDRTSFSLRIAEAGTAVPSSPPMALGEERLHDR